MGHNIHHSVYKESVNKKSVQAEWDDYAAHEDWQEGCSGLNADIRWIEKDICENEDEAYDYIKEHDNGWYDQLAVRFKQYPQKKTKRLADLEERSKKAYEKYYSMRSKLHYKDAKSKFIGCKNCGSKLSNKYLNANFCPLCNTDLRPQSTIDAIENARKSMEKLQKELKDEKNKKTGKPEILWLVKIEYHT